MERTLSVKDLFSFIAPDLVIALLGVPVALAFSGFDQTIIGPQTVARQGREVLLLVACWGNLITSFITYSIVFIGTIKNDRSDSLFWPLLSLLPVTISISMMAVYAGGYPVPTDNCGPVLAVKDSVKDCFDRAIGFMALNMVFVSLSVFFSPWRSQRTARKELRNLYIFGLILFTTLFFAYYRA